MSLSRFTCSNLYKKKRLHFTRQPLHILSHRKHYSCICFQQHQTVLIKIYSDIYFICVVYQFPEDYQWFQSRKLEMMFPPFWDEGSKIYRNKNVYATEIHSDKIRSFLMKTMAQRCFQLIEIFSHSLHKRNTILIIVVYILVRFLIWWYTKVKILPVNSRCKLHHFNLKSVSVSVWITVKYYIKFRQSTFWIFTNFISFISRKYFC